MQKLTDCWRGLWTWLDRRRIFLMSLAVMAFSSAFDGRFVASLMWPTPLGLIFGYGLNAAIDFASEEFAYWYAFFQRTAAKGSKQKKLSSWLLLGEAMMIYYSVVFSFAAIAESRPDVGLWLQWSGASWAPAALLWLGIARALRDAKLETDAKIEQQKEDAEIAAALAEQERHLRQEFAEQMASHRVVETSLTKEVMQRDGARCFYCGADLSTCSTGEIHIDHFIPRSNGGIDDPLNLVVSCQSCNLSKSDSMPGDELLHKFQLHLLKRAGLSAKDKILLANILGLLELQKDMATSFGVSPSYVSSIAKLPADQLSEDAQIFHEQLVNIRANGHKVGEAH